jgi:hypothetical protein
LKRFFYADFIEITTSVIKKIEELTEILYIIIDYPHIYYIYKHI